MQLTGVVHHHHHHHHQVHSSASTTPQADLLPHSSSRIRGKSYPHYSRTTNHETLLLLVRERERERERERDARFLCFNDTMPDIHPLVSYSTSVTGNLNTKKPHQIPYRQEKRPLSEALSLRHCPGSAVHRYELLTYPAVGQPTEPLTTRNTVQKDETESAHT